MRLFPTSLPIAVSGVLLLILGTMLVLDLPLQPADDAMPIDASSQPPYAVEITLDDYVIAPAVVHLPADHRIRMTVRNQGAVAHELEIEGLPFELTDIRPGDVVTVVFAAPPPGEYRMSCHYPGHFEQGMHATLIVSGDTARPPQ